mmetsp:Transcript_22785/g.27951  ORF Transcript_22785/g.27951 Transcript_22785/m.27951 type:complete len:273 (+) Transcript_22785:192-1010(+)
MNSMNFVSQEAYAAPTTLLAKRGFQDVHGVYVSPPAKKQAVSVTTNTFITPDAAAAAYRSLPMKVKIDKLKYSNEKERVAFLKKVLDKFPNTVEPVFRESFPDTVQNYNVCSTKTQKKKVLAETLKTVNDEDVLTEMICCALDHEPRIALVGSVMDEFMPKHYPKKFPKGHVMLSRCFLCKSTGNLYNCHDLKVCRECSSKSYTKTELKDAFYIQPKEANNIPHKEVEHGFYKSTVYIFTFKNAASACNKKFGCLGNMVREKMSSEHGDVIG